MTIYQKVIKVRKVCETKSKCEDCEYFVNCKNHFYWHSHRFFQQPL